MSIYEEYAQVHGPIPLDRLTVGMKHEREHADVLPYIRRKDLTPDDLFAMIAASHLREHPDYYQRLAKAGL